MEFSDRVLYATRSSRSVYRAADFIVRLWGCGATISHKQFPRPPTLPISVTPLGCARASKSDPF